MKLAHKYVNLKEPYNQDIKEHVTVKNFWKKRWNEISNARDIFKFSPLFVVLNLYQ